MGSRSAEPHEINAVRPTAEEMEAFLALDHDGSIVMVNLLKFKPNAFDEHYTRYAAGSKRSSRKLEHEWSSRVGLSSLF